MTDELKVGLFGAKGDPGAAEEQVASSDADVELHGEGVAVQCKPVRGEPFALSGMSCASGLAEPPGSGGTG